MSGKFTHLHVHSEYSLLDGGNAVGKLITRAKELEMGAIALTDHGNMFGAIKFYTKAISAGIKPIMGIEAYICKGDRRKKEGGMSANNHLVILAKNMAGYKNLLKLSSAAYIDGFYYRPRIDHEILAAHSEGLIITSACMSGEIAKAMREGNPDKAREYAQWYQEHFGDDFFIEIQQHIPEQNELNQPLIDLANKIGCGVVATNDVHFLTPDDYQAHDILCCISTGKLMDDENRMHYPKQLYLKSQQEMCDQFIHIPEACDNTMRIADMCDVELNFNEQHAPVYVPPKKMSPNDYMEKICLAGVKKMYGKMTPKIKERLYRELDVICGKGFASYFLIVWDFMNWARNKGIPCGTRGSGVGTIVGYVMDISNVDPLEYDLLFERFMDPERNEMPDIDVDICMHGRAEIIDYVRDKYGHVAQIITFGTMKARAVIRDVCRVVNIPLIDADKLAKLIPDSLGMTLEKSLIEEPKIQEWIDQDGRIKLVYDVGKRLEGMARHASVHAAGVVVCDEPLDNFLPLYTASGSTDLITQFDGPTVEMCGLLKMDFLGLRTLSTIERARQLVKIGKGKDIDPRQVDLKLPEVLGLFVDGRTIGVFQFESPGMRDLLSNMKPDDIRDLIAANALYRPGPMALIGDYNSRKHGEPWSLPHPIMEKILKETHGIMVYQEQVMQILNQLGDLPLARSYKLIKAISKKKFDVIESERAHFVEGCRDKKIDDKITFELFDLIVKFGGYGFNKSHSSQYAILAYQTAYFKQFYPTEFMAAVLTYECGSSDKLAEYMDEAKSMGIRVLPPDVSLCFADFTVIYDDHPDESKQVKVATGATAKYYDTNGESIRFGLSAVKGVGERAVKEIIRAREEKGKFENIYDLCSSIDTRLVNKGALEALIKAGAMDSLGGHRAQTIAALEDAIKNANMMQKDRDAGQMSFFESFEESDPEELVVTLPDIPPWPKRDMLMEEKKVLGMYVTDHPLADHATTIDTYSTANTSTMRNMQPNAEVLIGGMISRCRFMVTKNGRGAGSRMAMISLEDLQGSVEAVLFPDCFALHEELIASDRMIFIKGQLDFRRDDPSIRINAVYDMERAAEELTHAVIAKLEDDNANATKIEAFKDICKTFPGTTPVYVNVVTEQNMTVAIQIDKGVRPSKQFCKKIEHLLGPGTLKCTGPGTRI